MKKVLLLICVLLLWAGQGWALTYRGGLTSALNGGLSAFGTWLGTDGSGNAHSSLSWDVGFSTETGLWTYNYAWSGYRKALSNIIVQVSDTFGDELVFDADTGAILVTDNLFPGTTTPYELAVFSPGGQGNSHPGLPGDIYGLKFETSGDPTTYDFTIVTDRAPMWGNFYAKSGNGIYVYNSGFSFTAPEFDSHSLFSGVDELGYGWALVPDTESGGGGGVGNPVPEPGTFFLVGTGLVGLALLRRRQGR